MGRSPCCCKVGLKRGPWSTAEDILLTNYIQNHGEGHWRSLPKNAGLLRCGKSCRLRWMNYLRPGIKRGNITPDEEDLIVRLHALLGNRWSLIAGRLPGRTDNEIKNYWNTHLLKKLKHAGIELRPPPYRGRTGSRPDEEVKKGTDSDKDDDSSKEKTYRPKAERVSAAFSRTDSCNSGESSSGEKTAAEVGSWPPLFELEDLDYSGVGGFLGGEYGFPVADLMCSGDVNPLNKVYEEYLQLL